MNSMTGFGSANGREREFDIDVEIRSVNHRFLSLKQSLPEGLSRCEGEIEKLIRERIGRGSVNLTVSLKSLHSNGPVLPDPATLKRTVARLRSIQKDLGLKGEITFSALLGLPQVWSAPDTSDDEEAVWPAVRKLVVKALDELAKMRAREGEGIRKDLEGRLDAIVEWARRIGTRSPQVLEAYQRKLDERIAALMQSKGMEISKTDLVKEVAIYADRCDISEEVQRLASHVDQFRKIVRSKEQVGRRLDFLTQEMLRETNTLASKGSDSEVSKYAVEIKAELEKIKEQSENIE